MCCCWWIHCYLLVFYLNECQVMRLVLILIVSCTSIENNKWILFYIFIIRTSIVVVRIIVIVIFYGLWSTKLEMLFGEWMMHVLSTFHTVLINLRGVPSHPLLSANFASRILISDDWRSSSIAPSHLCQKLFWVATITGGSDQPELIIRTNCRQCLLKLEESQI